MSDRYEVAEYLTGYQVVLIGEEFYRDGPGNIRKRTVIKRRYSSFDTPIEAQIIADKWNREDRLQEP